MVCNNHECLQSIWNRFHLNPLLLTQTLRKGASEQEKDEFLKEALLMSNFKHDHIIRLLGVCLDNDPQFIILELMEGGDLLTYLRSSRPSPVSTSNLVHNACDGPTERTPFMMDLH